MNVVPILNIIGPVGIGKSSAAFAVSKQLSDKSIPHAIADLDDLRRCYPEPPNDPFNMALGFRNLAAVWTNYQADGAKCLIIPNVMEEPADFDKIRGAIPGAEIFVVRLDAPLDVNHDRIRGRETDAHSLKWHLNRSTQVKKELTAKQLEDVVVETQDKTPTQIAQEIISQWHDLERLI